MKDLIEYRIKMITRLEQAAQEFCSACTAHDPNTKVEGDWNTHQIAAHTRDVDKFIYGARIERTINEDNPLFSNFDADGWMEKNYNQAEALADVLNDFSNSIKKLCATLHSLPQEAWSRVSRHENLGGDMTLQLWAERSLAHIEEHLKALA